MSESDHDQLKRARVIIDWDDFISDQLNPEVKNILADMSMQDRARICSTQEYSRAAYSYFYQIRSGMNVILSSPDDKKGMDLVKEVRRASMGDAQRLALAHLGRGTVFAPYWFEIVFEEFRGHPWESVRQLADSVEIEALQEPSLFACATPNETTGRVKIQICTLLKAILKQLNAPISAARINSIEDPDRFHELYEPYVEAAHQIMTVCAYFCSHEISPGLLPAAIFLSQDACSHAKYMAHAQTSFLILHEMAHAGLGHLRPDGPCHPELFTPPAEAIKINGAAVEIGEALRQEIEADMWAFAALLETDMGAAIDIDSKLHAAGLMFGYLKAFEAMASAKFEESTKK